MRTTASRPHDLAVRLVMAAALAMTLAASGATSAPSRPRRWTPGPAVEDTTRLGFPFRRYHVTDSLGRRITFYLAPSTAEGRVPIVVFVQGSGCGSMFTRRGERIAQGIQALVAGAVGARARTLVVEKPGVEFLDDSEHPGAADGCSRAFLEEHTLDRWSVALVAAIESARRLPGIDSTRVLVVGHSEGGLVAARVAHLDPHVTHVALLASGGPNQLFDLVESARASGGDSAAAEMVRGWRAVRADPTSTTRFFLGHPYRRWATFLATSVQDELRATTIPIYLGHGTADPIESIAGFDALVADLEAKGRDVTVDRVAGADHGFATKPGDIDGLRAVLGRVAAWFLGTATR